MTNEMIIWNARCKLMEQGIIGTTGREVNVKTADGKTVLVMEPVQIHTYAGWKKRGYKVCKGERAVATIRIWKRTEQKREDDDTPKEKLFQTDAWFFSEEQVKRLEEDKQ